MLVLTRKTGQKLIIDSNIEITVLETRGESVKIGINAPKHVSIYREELFEAIQQENRQASQMSQLNQLDQAVRLIPKAPQAPPVSTQETPNS